MSPISLSGLSVAEQFVLDALNMGALELVPGGRQLKSGRLSPFFFNSGLFKTGAHLKALSVAYAQTIAASGIQYDVLFGPAYKGITLVAGTAMALADLGRVNDFTFNRKEAKDHGEGGLLVGASLSGRKVLIIDDVISNGAAKREAIEIIRAAGGIPIGLAISFDRKERGLGTTSAAQEFETQFKIPMIRIATVDDLISVLAKGADQIADWKSILPAVQAYRAEYGVA